MKFDNSKLYTLKVCYSPRGEEFYKLVLKAIFDVIIVDFRFIHISNKSGQNYKFMTFMKFILLVIQECSNLHLIIEKWCGIYYLGRHDG